MALTAQEVYRDFVTDGVPSSNWHDPKKSEIRTLLGQYEQIITAFTSNGGLVYATKAQMDADTAHGLNTMAWVVNDPVPGNNGIYRATGEWTRVADLPYSFIVASDVGDGTPDAIVATSSLPVSGSALVLLNVYETNTGSPVTISFNGGSPLTVKTNGGNDVSPGGLVPGSILLGRVSGNTFRIVSDQASAAVLAQAEQAVIDAQAIKDSIAPGTVVDGSVTDAKVAAPSKLKNRIEDPYVLTDFGGGYNKTGSQNETALTSALSNEQEILIPFHPDGYAFDDGEFVIQANQYVRNTGLNQVPVRSAAGKNGMFILRGYDERSGVEGLAIDMADASDSGSAAVRLNTAYGVGWGPRIKNMRFQNTFGSIVDDGARTIALTGFETTTSSKTVAVTSASHGMQFAQVITISGAPTVGGLNMNGAWVATPINSNTFTFTHSGTASSSAGPTGSGSGILEVGYLTDIEISDIQCRRARGPQIVSRKSRGSFLFRDVFVDNTVGLYGGDPPPFVTWDSILIQDFIGLEMERVDVVGQGFLGPNGNGDGSLAYYEAGARGIVINGVSPGERFVWLSRVRAEACCGHGIFISNVDFLETLWLEAFACRGYNIYLDDVTKGRMVSTYARGANDQTTTVPDKVAAAPATGALILANCSNIEMHIAGGDVATRHGIELINSTEINITGLRAELNAGAGVAEIGTSNYNTIDGYSVKNNTGGTLSLAGTSSRARNGLVNGSRRPDVASVFSANKGGADQAVPPGGFIKITFTSEALDARGDYDAANSRWTPPAGIVQIEAAVLVSAGLQDGVEAALLIYKNGVSAASRTFKPAAVTAATLSINTPPMASNGTDYFEAFVYFGGTGDKTISGAEAQTSFCGKIL